MSATVSTSVRPAAAKSPHASLWIFSTHWERIARFLVRRAAIARLRELDDDALKDIGLARSEIEAAAHGLMLGEDMIMAAPELMTASASESRSSPRRLYR